MRADKREALPYIFLGLVLLLLIWPTWIAGYSFPVGGGDLWGQLLPVWSYVGRFLRRGVLPLWSTQMMAGDPIVAEPQYGLLNPLNWGLFLSAALSSQALQRGLLLARGVLPLYVAGTGLYAYLRHSPLWRLRRSAALVGAAAYMLSDPFVTHLGHPHISDAMAYLPWCLLAVDQTLRDRRFRPLTVVALALVGLSGHFQTALYTSVATGLYALWRLLSQPPRHWIPHAYRLGLSAACALALCAPVLLPSVERYPLTERAILEVQPWTGYQWPASMTIDLFAPGFHGRGVSGFWGPWARVEGGYAGAAALVLALLGLLLALRRGRTWFFVALAAIGLLFALGYSGPLYPILARVDLIARTGKTARAIYLLAFAIAVLAASGVDALRSASLRLRAPRQAAAVRQAAAATSLAVLSGLLLLWANLPALLQAVPNSRQPSALRSIAAATGVAVAVLALAWFSTRRWAGAALLLLIVGELVVLSTWIELEPPSRTELDPVISYLRNDPSWYRVDIDAAARGLLSPSVLVNAGFDVPQGSGNPMELFSYTQFYWGIPSKGSPAYQLLGAKYIVVPKDAPPGGEGIWPVFIDAPKVDIHLNTNALPRVWLVYRTVPVTTIEEAYAVVFDETFEPAQAAAIERGPALDNGGTGTIEVAAYGGNRVEVVVRTSTEALLVLSDMHYPGWAATVDRQPTPIHKTNGIFRGVVVPPGEHRVVMRYRPRTFRFGVGLAAMALLVLLTAAFRRTRRRTHMVE